MCINPTTLSCPTFTGPNYAAARATFTSNTVTEEQSIAILIMAWKSINASDSDIWRRDMVEQAALEEAENRRVAEVAETQAAALEAARVEAQQDEMKKN